MGGPAERDVGDRDLRLHADAGLPGAERRVEEHRDADAQVPVSPRQRRRHLARFPEAEQRRAPRVAQLAGARHRAGLAEQPGQVGQPRRDGAGRAVRAQQLREPLLQGRRPVTQLGERERRDCAGVGQAEQPEQVVGQQGEGGVGARLGEHDLEQPGQHAGDVAAEVGDVEDLVGGGLAAEAELLQHEMQGRRRVLRVGDDLEPARDGLQADRPAVGRVVRPAGLDPGLDDDRAVLGPDHEVQGGAGREDVAVHQQPARHGRAGPAVELTADADHDRRAGVARRQVEVAAGLGAEQGMPVLSGRPARLRLRRQDQVKERQERLTLGRLADRALQPGQRLGEPRGVEVPGRVQQPDGPGQLGQLPRRPQVDGHDTPLAWGGWPGRPARTCSWASCRIGTGASDRTVS